MRPFLLSLLLVGCAFAQTQVDYQTQIKRKPIVSGSVLPTSCTIASNLFFLTTTKVLYVCDGTKYGSVTPNASVIGFGATGNGTTDDTAAFVAAYNSIVAVGGGIISMPCPAVSYHIAGTLTISVPTVSLKGDNESCVKITHPEAGRPIVWQMNPFTIMPAGTFSNFTIIGSNAGSEGILGGQSVGATYENINVSGFTATGAAGIHLHNAGSQTTWTEQNSFTNVGVGGSGITGSQYNTNGILLDSDDPADSFGHNNFSSVHFNVSTGQVGFNLQSGFLYASRIYLDCNVDNQLAGSTAGLCFRSNGNWDANNTQISGEAQIGGIGTGTQYSGQVEASGRFANLKSSTLLLFGPGDTVLPLNNLTAATDSPNVSLVANSAITSWDTGSFTLNGDVTTPEPTQRGNCSSLGLLIGAATETPYMSLCNAPFVIGSVAGSDPIGNMTARYVFDPTGNADITGKLFVNWPYASLGSVDPNATEDINGKLAVRGAQNHYNAGIGSAFSVGGITVSGIAGYANIGLTSTTGFNENIIFDGNSDASYGSAIGTNIAHPITSCYSVDANCFEWYKKRLNTPIDPSDRVAVLDGAGVFSASGFNSTGAVTAATQIVAGTSVSAPLFSGHLAGISYGRATSTSCPTSASDGATCAFTVNWNIPFSDSNYSASCTIIGPTGHPHIEGITTQTVAGVIVQVANGSAAQAVASGGASMGCTAIEN